MSDITPGSAGPSRNFFSLNHNLNVDQRHSWGTNRSTLLFWVFSFTFFAVLQKMFKAKMLKMEFPPLFTVQTTSQRQEYSGSKWACIQSTTREHRGTIRTDEGFRNNIVIFKNYSISVC